MVNGSIALTRRSNRLCCGGSSSSYRPPQAYLYLQNVRIPRLSFVAAARSSRALSCDFLFLRRVSGTRMSFWVGMLLHGERRQYRCRRGAKNNKHVVMGTYVFGTILSWTRREVEKFEFETSSRISWAPARTMRVYAPSGLASLTLHSPPVLPSVLSLEHLIIA
jgi:hypothetical protein